MKAVTKVPAIDLGRLNFVRQQSLPIVCVLFTVLGALQALSPAQACATCICGDPTLTTMGAEKPFEGRMRLALTTMQRSESTGQKGVNFRETDETRNILAFTYWPSARLALGFQLPLVDKTLTQENLSQQESSALGDIDLDARWYIWQDRELHPQHLAGVQAGLRVPSADEETSNGVVLDRDAQPGGGLWLANVGLWHAYFKFPWMLYSSAIVTLGLDEGWEDYSYGGSLKISSTAQYAVNYQVALRLGVDMRWSGRDEYDGTRDADSGGFIAFATPGLVLMPAENLIFHLGAQLPIIEELNGNTKEDSSLQIGLTYDF